MSTGNISGVEAIRQLIEAQKNWHVFRAKKEDGKNTIYIGDTSLTEEELVNIKSGGNVDEKIGEIEEQLESTNNSIGDIESALEAILAIQKELLPPILITFTIEGIEYNAIEGMTWDEWVNSKYNTVGAYLQETAIAGSFFVKINELNIYYPSTGLSVSAESPILAEE